jgi:tetratricopeptide (TPR) repeat protein
MSEAFARGQNASFDHALELARESARRDPRCAECRAILGYILMTREWKWKEAETELEQAWNHNRRDPQIRNWRAQLLPAIGRLSEAQQQAQACVSLDVTRAGSFALLASVLYFSGQYREAIQEADKALGLHLPFQPAFKWRYRSHLMLGEYCCRAA